MTYTPVTFSKAGQTKVADTPRDYYNLLYDGWTPGAPAAAVTDGNLTATRGYARSYTDAAVHAHDLTLASVSRSGSYADLLNKPTLAAAAISGAYADLTGKPTIPTTAADLGAATATALTAHTGNTANPHAVTKAQVGLGSVDNTSDASKPVSTAQAAADTAVQTAAATDATTKVNAHANNTANPHVVTKAQVGLGSVDNTSDASKPVSTAQAAADTAVQTAAATDATTKVNAHANNTANPHAVTKAQVGLGNVDNTSDANKPVSTAQAAATTAAMLASDTGYPQAPYTYDPWNGSSAASAMSANRVSYCRAKGSGTITKVAIMIGAQSGNIDVGVYRNTGSGSLARPGTKLASTGSIPCPAAGEQVVTLSASVDMRPGDWFAIVSDNATASFQRILGGVYTNGMSFVCVQTATFPLPTTPSGLAANGNCYLMVGVA